METKIDYCQAMENLIGLCKAFGGTFVPSEMLATRTIKEGDYNGVREFVSNRLMKNIEFNTFWKQSSWPERADHLSKLLDIFVNPNSLLQNFNRH